MKTKFKFVHPLQYFTDDANACPIIIYLKLPTSLEYSNTLNISHQFTLNFDGDKEVEVIDSNLVNVTTTFF